MTIAGCAQRPGPAPAPPVAPPPPQVDAPRPPVPPPPPVRARARNWDEYRHQAALQLVEANRAMTYGGVPPEPLLAIPVLEIELDGDGSVRRVVVLRYPKQARDTVQLAIDAIHRAGPFGAVHHLPRPWKFTEVFLFNDDRRFKPRTLDR